MLNSKRLSTELPSPRCCPVLHQSLSPTISKLPGNELHESFQLLHAAMNCRRVTVPFKYIAIFRRRPDRDVGSPPFPLAPDLISPYCFPYGYILFIRQDFSSFTFGYILHPSSMLSRCAMRSVVFETSLQRTLRVLLLLLQNRPIATVFGPRNSKHEKLDKAGKR